MTRTEKDRVIQELTATITDASVLYLADTSGLDSQATSNLRRTCFEKGVSLQVVKNTLLKRALENVEGRDYSEILPTLKGTTSIMISEVGNVPARLIKSFRKNNDKPLLKAAYIESMCFVGDNQLQTLVDIKSKEELLGDIIALIQSPIKNVVSALKSSSNTLAGLMKTLKERQQ